EVLVFEVGRYTIVDLEWLTKALNNFKGHVICIGDYTRAKVFNKGLREDWCFSGPLDPELIVSKVKELCKWQGQKTEEPIKESVEPSSLLNDLKGFLGIK
ncbi:MAG: hypothetical protein L3V56_14695, partial [Candidatus Magnetoovum sp. WYHC-5]|nr:hypothetical protein [Candidatus Magnetoovum sp. WYHC-5]